ncbi:MAG: hypothetical protein M1838_000236 [Thelocarpon superellum]|nr:MAG: hypothetical protein M1838_000236 [Thelocarpon superellum]
MPGVASKMENEPVFDTEARVEARLGRFSSTAQLDEHEADTVYPRTPDVAGAQDEETPLLVSGGGLDGAADGAGKGDDVWPGAADLEGLPWWKRPSVYWLLPSFILFTLAFGGIIVPKLNLILTLICRQYMADRAFADPSHQTLPVIFGDENPQCQIPEVQSLVAKFTLYCNLAAGILSAISSPKLGAISDRFGRRRVIATTTCGMLVGEIITIVAATYPDVVSVNWLLLGYACDGLFGSFTAAMALTHSYATDCTPPSRRNVAFGYFHGCLFTGIAVGPIIAGYVIKATGQVLSVFYIALACHLIFICFLLFIIPESLTKARQLAAREKHRLLEDRTEQVKWVKALKSRVLLRPFAIMIRSFINLFTPLAILFPTGDGSSRAVRMNLLFLSAVDTITFGVAMGSMTVVLLYSEFQFHWGNFEASFFMSVVNTGRVLTLLIILPLITSYFRRRNAGVRQRNSGSDQLDMGIIRVAVFIDMLGYLGYTLVRTGSLFTASGVVASLGGIGPPTIQSALTKHVPPDRTGQLLGATGLLHALARVVAPTIFNLIYSQTVGAFTQTVFVCLTSTFGLAFLLTWFIRPHVYLDEPIIPSPVPSSPSPPPAASPSEEISCED